MATSDSKGHFGFALDKAASDSPYVDGPAWHGAKIAAVAPGFGPEWIDAGTIANSKDGEATFKLVPDDIPIRGRVLDTQGRPVAGVAVHISQIGVAKSEPSLDAMLASGQFDYENASSWYADPAWLAPKGDPKTGADGRFEIRGVGRDQVIGLEFLGPATEKATLYAAARPLKTKPKPRPRPTRPSGLMVRKGRPMGAPPALSLYGSTFDVIVGPSKPIAGVVRMKGTGKPVAGVEIHGYEAATWTHVQDISDEQGRYDLNGLPKGQEYNVTAYPAPGQPYLSNDLLVTDTEGLRPIETVLELPPGIPVVGSLIDKATGKRIRPQQIMHVKLPTNRHEGHSQLSDITSADKTFKLTVPPGEAMILAGVSRLNSPYMRARLRKEDKGKGVGGREDKETMTVMMDAHHAYKIVDVPADAKQMTVELELKRGISRTGRLVGPDGKPIRGSEAYGLTSSWGNAKKLASDTFEVIGLEPGQRRRVIFTHEGGKLAGAVTLQDADLKSDHALVVRMAPVASAKGRLVDDDGLPLTGVDVSIWTYDLDGNNLPHGPGQNAMWPNDEAIEVDAEGRFQIAGFIPGVEGDLGIGSKSKSGFWFDAGDAVKKLLIGSGEVRDLGDVKVKAKAIGE